MTFTRRLIRILLFRGLPIWFCVHVATTTIDGLFDDPNSSLYIVILGNKVNSDGSLSERLKSRLDKGLDLYNEHTEKVIVSGGLGKEGHYEGHVMKAYLVHHGIPAHQVIADNQGWNTRATAHNCLSWLPTDREVVVVSQYHHISRTKLAFRNVGFTEVRGVHGPYFELRDLYSVVREFFAYYKYLIWN